MDTLHSERPEGDKVFFRRRLDSLFDVTDFRFVDFSVGRLREEYLVSVLAERSL